MIVTSCFLYAWEIYGIVQNGKCGGSRVERVEVVKKKRSWENQKEKKMVYKNKVQKESPKEKKIQNGKLLLRKRKRKGERKKENPKEVVEK